ncbi:MAG: zinc dependent phospholipase C family protein [Gemmatimonadales bacterium]
MSRRRLAVGAVVAVLLLVLFPTDAHAWTPGTHIFLGETVLGNLKLLPPLVADLLHAFPYDFLYGSIAPDTSLAKHYVPPGRHSHYWNVGQETFDFAEADALRAFGLGYLAHLAADTVAHNYFVPRQLLLTSSSKSMGHSYWELRAETHLTDRFSRKARDLIQMDHTAADRHLGRIISPTIFSVETNRRLFRGMVHLAHTRRWQQVIKSARERSRWALSHDDVERHLSLSYDLTMEMLHEVAALAGHARRLDPSGAEALRRVKQWRRRALLGGGLIEPERLLTEAEERYPLPSTDLGFWRSSFIERPWADLLAGGPDSLAITLPSEESDHGEG